MTNLDVMIRWFAPETDAVILHCDECGCEMISSDGRNCKVLCKKCKQERHSERANIRNRELGVIRFTFEDPATDLAYAVITRALEDKTRKWTVPNKNYCNEPSEFALDDCNPADFIADGGVELWLAALGIGIRPSMSKAIRELEA